MRRRSLASIIGALAVLSLVLGYAIISSAGNGGTPSTSSTNASTGGHVSPTSSSQSQISTTLSGGGVVIQNVKYCTIGNDSELMDVYLPANLAKGTGNGNVSDPAVVVVHGGGWVYGSKDESGGGLNPVLLQAGFVVASINYFMPPSPSSVPPYGFPLNVEDVACAVRFLRASASQYHIDPERIGLFGGSAGGNLVSLEALAAMNGTFDGVGPYQGYSSRVEAVVDEYGPSNITYYLNVGFVENYGPSHFDILKDVFGDNQTDMKEASPLNYVSSGEPPFLILQGLNDTTVPPSQSMELYDFLQAAGDVAQLVLVQHAGHGFVQVGSLPIAPSLTQLTGDEVNFFISTLGQAS